METQAPVLRDVGLLRRPGRHGLRAKARLLGAVCRADDANVETRTGFDDEIEDAAPGRHESSGRYAPQEPLWLVRLARRGDGSEPGADREATHLVTPTMVGDDALPLEIRLVSPPDGGASRGRASRRADRPAKVGTRREEDALVDGVPVLSNQRGDVGARRGWLDLERVGVAGIDGGDGRD